MLVELGLVEDSFHNDIVKDKVFECESLKLCNDIMKEKAFECGSLKLCL